MSNPAHQRTPRHFEEEDAAEDIVFREFKGVNVQSIRQSIEDDQFAWLENLMPIAHGNLPVVPAPSVVLQTFAGKVVMYAMEANVGGTDYAFVFYTNGSCDQVLLTSPYTVTVVAAAGKFASGVQASQWKNAGIVIIDPTAGYFDWNVTAPNTLTLIDAATKGTSIAVYGTRVWIGNGRATAFTDVNSYNSFAGAGGSFTITDPYLHKSINVLAVANGFLYLFGDTSVDALSNVVVTAGVTTFTRQNLSASVGCTLPQSVFPYLRSLMFANPSGFYALTGATPKKVSDDLDNLVAQIDFTQPFYGGQVFLFNILCAAFLFTVNDIFTPAATNRQLLAVYFRDRWFFASQGTTLKYLLSEPITGVSTLFALDDSNLYRLFQNASGDLSSRLQTKLWDGGKPLLDKQALRAGLGVVYGASGNQTIAVTVDNEFGSLAVAAIGQKPTVQWQNNSLQNVQWQNSLSQNVNFTVSGYIFDKSKADTGGGKYLGLTCASTFNGLNYALLALQYRATRPW